MEIIETPYRDKIGISCKIIGLLSPSSVIEYFNRLREKNTFSCSPRFKRHEIELMEFNSEQNRLQLQNILTEIY